MSVLTRTRFLVTILLALSAPGLFAASPSARTSVRMAVDPATSNIVLFGGVSTFDRGTSRAYTLDETWIWNGIRWFQRFPATTPPARSGHAMVSDTAARRIVMFGGTNGTADLNDTWVWKNGNWAQLSPPNSPPARFVPAAAFDSLRGRIVLFGGNKTTVTNNSTVATPLNDTWEFDGANWTQRSTTGPQLTQPILVYHEQLDQMLLIGTATDGTTSSVKTYRYDPAAGTWTELTSANKPPCAADASASYSPVEQKVILAGGVCTTSEVTDEVWKWDGSDWAKVDTTAKVERVFAAAQAFDRVRGNLVRFGGTAAFGSPGGNTYLLADNWALFVDVSTPSPRSLFAVVPDPDRQTTWMYGGLTASDNQADLWQYKNGQWQFVANEKTPTVCVNPNGAYDTDRKKMVLVCADSTTFEWDGTTWTSFTDLKTKPVYRRFSSMVYDQTLKKTVLFGGFDDTNYQDRTWLWDGTQWSEQKNKKPTARSLTSMWFDPVLKKTLIYGGVGRPTTTDAVVRYSDMWSLDSSGWTKLTPSTTPGMRYGAQVVADPAKNRVLLFGGLLYEETTEPTLVRKQAFQNDLWQWNGTTWQKLSTPAAPTARQNGGFFIDPTRKEIVLFAGYGGFYLSDTWILAADDTWSPRQESTARRRSLVTRPTNTGTAYISAPAPNDSAD